MKRALSALILFISVSSLTHVLFRIFVFYSDSDIRLNSFYNFTGWFFIFLPRQLLLPYELISKIGIDSFWSLVYLKTGIDFLMYTVLLGILGIVSVLSIKREERVGVQLLYLIGILLFIAGIWNAIIFYLFYLPSVSGLLLNSGLNIFWGVVYLLIAKYFSKNLTSQDQLEAVKHF